MVHISEIQSQLTKLGIHLSRWFTPELKELQRILMDNEKIIAAAPGRYFSGFALMVATDQRLLLIDKRTFFMTVEDTRYDMISEIDLSGRIYDVTVHIFTLNKQHNFTSMRYKDQLRQLCAFVQRKVWETRQYQQSSTTAGEVTMPAPQYDLRASETPIPVMSSGTTTSSHLPHIPRPPTPHLPNHIGFAAVNGTHRFTPNAYTNHLTAMRRQAMMAEN